MQKLWVSVGNAYLYGNLKDAADLWCGNWMGIVFLDQDFRIDVTVINASDRGVYSKSGIYPGC